MGGDRRTLERSDVTEGPLDALAVESHKDLAKHWSRALLFAALLLLSHLLDIKPSEIEAGGLKISLKDPAVVRGALALVYFYYLSMCVSVANRRAAFTRFNKDRVRLRYYVRLASARIPDKDTKRLRRKTPQEVKKLVKQFGWMDCITLTPFYAGATILTFTAFGFMLVDIWAFVSHSFDTVAQGFKNLIG
jgi:hypothetical protein